MNSRNFWVWWGQKSQLVKTVRWLHHMDILVMTHMISSIMERLELSYSVQELVLDPRLHINKTRKCYYNNSAFVSICSHYLHLVRWKGHIRYGERYVLQSWMAYLPNKCVRTAWMSLSLQFAGRQVPHLTTGFETGKPSNIDADKSRCNIN